MFWLGLALFAFGILFSICLHEAGHMATAKAFGMKVTQYFAGFGPTIWSTRRGETEYGVKAIPAGGFVKIVGMTPLEPVADRDDARAFWRRPLWQRTVVLSAGSATHFALAIVVAYAAAVTTGLPDRAAASFNPDRAAPAVYSLSDCIPTAPDAGTCAPGDPAGAAKAAGLHVGDRIVAVDGTPVSTYSQLVSTIRAQHPGPTPITYERDGRTATVSVDLASVRRYDTASLQAEEKAAAAQNRPIDLQHVKVVPAAAIGVSGPPVIRHYSAASAVPGTATFFGGLLEDTGAALKRFPERIPNLVSAIGGGHRSADTPVSVVGASRIGGEAFALGQPIIFLTLFIGLNVFIGVFNLLPLLPLDGGHVAVAWFERARSALARRRGRPDPGRVDYEKLMPVTYAVILVFGAVSLLTLTADIVNPIRLS